MTYTRRGFQSFEPLSRLPWAKCRGSLRTQKEFALSADLVQAAARSPLGTRRRAVAPEVKGSPACLAVSTKPNGRHNTPVRSRTYAVHAFRSPSVKGKRADRRAAFGRWDSLGQIG
ncbi:hypothetical protein GCM10010270_06240 [Streptomyces violaceus]|nr:hypothetical protein GCM10010270_06240 [Streptomyces janthinus]